MNNQDDTAAATPAGTAGGAPDWATAALVLAAFCHAYIWVHYFCTEKPDMKRIYG